MKTDPETQDGAPEVPMPVRLQLAILARAQLEPFEPVASVVTDEVVRDAHAIAVDREVLHVVLVSAVLRLELHDDVRQTASLVPYTPAVPLRILRHVENGIEVWAHVLWFV